jgi:hypothetical protein
MFGSDDSPRPLPPPLPEAAPAAPQFATGMGKLAPKGKPRGGTLLTSPVGVTPANTIQRSLIAGSI